jgi:hypothetical protein
MDEAQATLSKMRSFLAAALPETIERVRHFEVKQLAFILDCLNLASDVVEEISRHWDVFLGEDEWVSLLAALLDYVEVNRGNIEAPIPIWPDLDERGTSGRLLYFYLFALSDEGARAYLTGEGAPEDVINQTFDVLARHCATHQRKWGNVGVDAGWWMFPALRGELVQIGSLQFHRVTLGVGTLSPASWFGDTVTTLGVGFRRGDPSLGLHIPQGVDLSPEALNSTMSEARDVLGRLWPVHQRRLATCQTWMLDDRLRSYLEANSNIVRFQQRFNLPSLCYEDDADVLDFVFQSPNTALEELPQSTTLQRAIVEVLGRGEHWRNCTGWFDFDGL